MEFNKYFDDFKNDSLYSEFFNDNFNLQNAITKTNDLSFNEKISKISSGIDFIKSTINQVTSANSDIFFELNFKVYFICKELSSICTDSENLNKILEGMKTKVQAPHQQLSKEIILLQRLEKTCNILRDMLKVIFIMDRVEDVKRVTYEEDKTVYLNQIVKLSQYAMDYSVLLAPNLESFLRLKSLDNILDKLNDLKSTINQEAQLLLKNGLEKNDVNEITVALNVFAVFGYLDQELENFIFINGLSLQKISNHLFSSLDENDENSNIPLSKKNNLIKTIFRSNCKDLLELAYTQFNYLSTIMKLLKKKRNSRNELLIEIVKKKDALFAFWDRITSEFTLISNKISNNSSITIKMAVESDYPKLLDLFIDYWNKFLQIEPNLKKKQTLRSTIELFEKAYLSNSLSLLFDSVNRIFPSDECLKNQRHSAIPTERDVDSIFKNITSEFLAAKFDPTFTDSICQNITKTIELFTNKCEELVVEDDDATQVIAKFNSNQRFNATLVHLLNYLAEQMEHFVQKEFVTESFKENLRESLDPVDELAGNIIEPFLIAIQEAIENIIYTIHNENYNIDGFVCIKVLFHFNLI